MNEHTAVVKRVFNAPIEKVFSAWVEAEQMKQWYSPEGMTTPDARSEQRKGGKFYISVQMGEKRFDTQGKYIEYDQPNKLVCTWGWKGASESSKPTMVIIESKAVEKTKTEVILTHSGFKNRASAAQHNAGWIGTFNKLEQYLAS